MMGTSTAVAATVQVTVTRMRATASSRRPIDVEELLVWTYRQQKAHVVLRGGRGLAPQEAELEGMEPHGGSNLSAVERILRLGVIVDQSGPDPGQLHPDAERVHRAVERLDHRALGLPLSALLIQHAVAADRPDPMVGVMPRPQPLLTWNGKIAVEWEDAGRRRGYCPVVYEPSATRILQAREEWMLWHRGLRLLHLVLTYAGLQSWRVLPPVAPAKPWEAELISFLHESC